MGWLSKLGKIALGVGLGAVTGGAGAALVGGLGGVADAATGGKTGGKDWLGPVITSGIGAAANIYGANRQAGANTQAADIQAQSNREAIASQTKANEEALAFQKQRYAELTANSKPWLQSGQQATGRMANLLHLGGETPGPVTRPPASAQMVQLRAPDGAIEAVPADQVDHFLQQGATRVAA